MKAGLPDLYDWIDGGKVGEPTNFWQRMVNTYSPWFRQSDRIGPEKQFLIDIEFDGRPSLRTNGRGVEYTPEQRSEITRLIGESGYFRDELRKIMKSIDGKEFRRQYKKAGVGMDRELYLRIHKRINYALKAAKQFAEAQLSDQTGIREKLYVNNQIEWYTQTGETDKIKQLLNNRNK